MALHMGTRYPRTLRGIMVLSGYEVLSPTREREETPANRTTPMLFCHGTADPLVPIAAGRLAYEAHAQPERPAEWHEFPMAHEVSPAELTVIRQWLGARFGRMV
jgi:phospholipase/carboxylesterase